MALRILAARSEILLNAADASAIACAIACGGPLRGMKGSRRPIMAETQAANFMIRDAAGCLS
jgi:hypothetical protein